MLRKKIFKCKAYAKINLFLNVLNKTKNNLHKLKSLVCFIDLYDEIVITESKEFSIKIKGPFKNFIKKNIIEKTFVTFSNFINLKTNYKISLNKTINWIEVHPKESQGVKTVWRWGKEKASNNLNTVLFAKESNSDSGFQIVKKYREITYVLNTVWSEKEIKTDRGTLETKALFDSKKYFDNEYFIDLSQTSVELNNVFAINWSRFGNVTLEKWSKSKKDWILQ